MVHTHLPTSHMYKRTCPSTVAATRLAGVEVAPLPGVQVRITCSCCNISKVGARFLRYVLLAMRACVGKGAAIQCAMCQPRGCDRARGTCMCNQMNACTISQVRVAYHTYCVWTLHVPYAGPPAFGQYVVDTPSHISLLAGDKEYDQEYHSSCTVSCTVTYR